MNAIDNLDSRKTVDDNEESSTYKPSDAIYEILTRVPLEYFEYCRWVCNEWRNMMYEFEFIHLHCLRTKTIRGYFIQSWERCKYRTCFVSLYQTTPNLPPSLDFLPPNIKIEASSHYGLLCCVELNYKSNRYLVCKPATREFRRLPNPKLRYFTVKTAMVVRSLHPLYYKIIRFSWPKHTKNHLRCEIFDSRKWTWKQSCDVRLSDMEFLTQAPCLLMGRIFYCMTTKNRIFSFDIENETLKMISFPEEALKLNNDYWINKSIMECEGKISLIYYDIDKWMERWELSSSRHNIWERKETVDLESMDRKGCKDFIASLYTHEVALMKNIFKIIWYHNGETKTTHVGINQFLPEQFFRFESDTTPYSL